MHKLNYLFTILLLLNSCKKDKPDSNNSQINTPTENTLQITVHNMAGNEDIVFSDLRYTNASGNLYSVQMLKYYISNISLHKKNGSYIPFQKYKLIDASVPATCSFEAGKPDAGEYDSLVFYIGVDANRNHSGVQDGDLDVSKGMFWTWNTGYIFYKHEGQYRNSAMQTKSLIFHLGSDNAYSRVELPISLLINGNKNMHIKLDLNSVYSSPDNIDFNTDNNRQSTSAGDAAWIGSMKLNLKDAFSFLKTE